MAAITDEWGFTEHLKQDNAEYKHWYDQTVNAMKETLALIESEDFLANGWKLEGEDKGTGDKVFLKNVEKRGKTFLLTAVVEGDPKHVFEINYYQSNDKPHWNPTIKEFNKVLDVGDQTKLIYWCSNEILAGLVSSRDFVDVQGYRKMGDSYVLGGSGTVWKEKPEQKSRVRGENGLNLLKMSPVAGKPGYTKITWVNSTDLKGLLPKSVVEKAMNYMMLEYTKHLRTRLTRPAIIN